MTAVDPGNLIQFDAERHKLGDEGLDQLIRGVLASVRELERKNRTLEERNAELAGSLDQANERIQRFEKSVLSDADLSQMAVRAVSQVLGRAETAVDAMLQQAKAEVAQTYQEASRRALELQRQAVSLIEDATAQDAQRAQEVSLRAVEMFKEVRRSLSEASELSLHEREDSGYEGAMASEPSRLSEPFAKSVDRLEHLWNRPSVAPQPAESSSALPDSLPTQLRSADQSIPATLQRLSDQLDAVLRAGRSREITSVSQTAAKGVTIGRPAPASPGSDQVAALRPRSSTEVVAESRPALPSNTSAMSAGATKEPIRQADSLGGEPLHYASPGSQAAYAAEIPGPQARSPHPTTSHILGEELEASRSEPQAARPLLAPKVETQEIELVAGHFRNFASLSAFHHALQRLDGVVEAKPAGFDHGILRMSVRYADPMPLAGRLIAIEGFRVRLTAASDSRIELTVD